MKVHELGGTLGIPGELLFINSLFTTVHEKLNEFKSEFDISWNPEVGSVGGGRFAFPGSEHPVAAGMLNEALDNHYHSTPHNVFGLEH